MWVFPTDFDHDELARMLALARSDFESKFGGVLASSENLPPTHHEAFVVGDLTPKDSASKVRVSWHQISSRGAVDRTLTQRPDEAVYSWAAALRDKWQYLCPNHFLIWINEPELIALCGTVGAVYRHPDYRAKEAAASFIVESSFYLVG